METSGTQRQSALGTAIATAQTPMGAVLREARIDVGWTLEELAVITGIPKQTLSAMECGRVQNWKAVTVARLEFALGLLPHTMRRRAAQHAEQDRQHLRRQLAYHKRVNDDLRADLADQDRQIQRLSRRRSVGG